MVVAITGSSGCAATRARRGAPPPSGFLGNYSELREGYAAHKAYVAPGIDWAGYHAIHIDSVVNIRHYRTCPATHARSGHRSELQ
jgi:hypothetical protein